MRCVVPFFAIVFMSLSMAFSQSVSSEPRTAFDQHLIDQQKKFLRDVESRNSTAVDRAVAEDFMGIGPNGDSYDRSEVVTSAENGTPRETRAYDFHVVKLSPDSAVVAYDLIVPGEQPRYRHMADTWARTGGRWQLKFRQITPNLWSANDVD